MKVRTVAAVLLATAAIVSCEREKTSAPPPPPTPESEVPPTQIPQHPAPAPAPSAPEAGAAAPQAPSAAPEPSDSESRVPAAEPMSSPPETGAAAPAETQSDALRLARQSGCLACHSVEKKVVGPPWRAVAERYRDDKGARAALIEKVKKGGKGNWTEVTGGMTMPPYAPRVSDSDIEVLVDFVLSL